MRTFKNQTHTVSRRLLIALSAERGSLRQSKGPLNSLIPHYAAWRSLLIAHYIILSTLASYTLCGTPWVSFSLLARIIFPEKTTNPSFQYKCAITNNCNARRRAIISELGPQQSQHRRQLSVIPETGGVQRRMNNNILEVENQKICYFDACIVSFVEGVLFININLVRTWKTTTVNNTKH